jgi:secernin
LTALDLTKYEKRRRIHFIHKEKFSFRLSLERSDTAESAVDIITQLVNQYNKSDEASIENFPKYGIFICDKKDVFVLDICGSDIWAAEKVTDTFRSFGSGFSVKTKIDKKSEGLEEKLKELGFYDGSGDLNFSEALSLLAPVSKWPGKNPESGFSAQKMFEVLRSSTTCKQEEVASSFVTVLKSNVSVFWLTGTSNPSQSVFKPFIFTLNARVSPLTAITDDGDETILRKLHANCSWNQIGGLLKSLEKSCVDEVDQEDVPLNELDELLKDCVEAEVKFYR